MNTASYCSHRFTNLAWLWYHKLWRKQNAGQYFITGPGQEIAIRNDDVPYHADRVGRGGGEGGEHDMRGVNFFSTCTSCSPVVLVSNCLKRNTC